MEAAATSAPCPQCLEAAAPAAGTCPSCGSDLHVDVLTPPIADDRTRYRVARELAAAGWPWPPFADGLFEVVVRLGTSCGS